MCPLILFLFLSAASTRLLVTGFSRRSLTTLWHPSNKNRHDLSQFSESSSNDISTATALTVNGPPLPPLTTDTKRLFLVRHGEVINPGGKHRPVFYGAQDVPLSPLGEQEATAAAIYLQQYPLVHVFSSPLSRAVYGAERVVERQQQQQSSSAPPPQAVTIVEGFREINRGEWCGKTRDEIGAEQLAQFDACVESVTPGGGGESYPALQSRVLAALRRTVLEKVQPGEAAAIVSHLQVTRAIVAHAQGLPTNQLSQILIATASVTAVDCHVVDDSFTVHFQSFKPAMGLEESYDGAN